MRLMEYDEEIERCAGLEEAVEEVQVDSSGKPLDLSLLSLLLAMMHCT